MPSERYGSLIYITLDDVQKIYTVDLSDFPLLAFLKEWFTNDNKTGCRYITVDALKTAQGFYESCDFKVLVTPEENDETVLMYYDLKQYVTR